MADQLPPAVELQGITKRFPGVVANDAIDLRVEAGEIHAIVGENGAGKSTLMKILYGMQRPDEGEQFIDGRSVQLTSPSAAINAGIGMVHQHFMLADQMSVLENIILGSEPSSVGLVRFRRARQRITELGEAYGLTVDLDEDVEALGVGERQRVEILKVLYRGARILIMDEPTAVLVPQEVDELFRNLRDLRGRGETIIFISHKLDEVLDLADRITVIRRGRTIATVDAGAVTASELAELMVGSELPSPAIRDSTVTDTTVLTVRGVTTRSPGGRAVIDSVDLTIREGEIVGIAGVEGNGQSELIDVVLGLRDTDSGEILLGAEELTGLTTRERRERGVAYIPEDRHRRGLLLSSPLWENSMLGHQTQAPYATGPWIDRAGARRRTESIIEEFDVRTPGDNVPGHALSGGNQQKLIVGRELSSEARVLLANHPTRGIDVGAQAAVWQQLRNARAQGLGVLLISADLDELIGLSDTLHVMLRGRLVANLDPNDITPETLGAHMTGAAA